MADQKNLIDEIAALKKELAKEKELRKKAEQNSATERNDRLIAERALRTAERVENRRNLQNDAIENRRNRKSTQ